MSYTRKDKGKRKQRESTPKLKCFLCDGPHLTRKCPKRKALSTLIEKSEKTMEDACLASIQMIGALQVMPKASPQVSEVGEQAEKSGSAPDLSGGRRGLPPCENKTIKKLKPLS